MEVELKDTLNATWKNDKTGFGFRMMQKMGWKEDKGLGKNESGIVDNVKIQKRETGLGLGSQDITDNANRGWSATATSFNAVLDVLKESFGKKEEKKKAKAKKSAPTVTISVGMKYKRISESKNLGSKTEAEKRAILGSAMVVKSSSSGKLSSASTEGSTQSEASTVVDAFSSLKAALQSGSSSSSGSGSGSEDAESNVSASDSGRSSKREKKEKDRGSKREKKEKKDKKDKKGSKKEK